MHRTRILPDGAWVTRQDETVDGRPLLFVGRIQFSLDSGLRERLSVALSRHGFDVYVYEAPGEIVHRRIHSKLAELPLWPRRMLKSLLLLVQPDLWRHFGRAKERYYDTIEFRQRSFKAAVQAVGQAPIVVARSAGARVASSLADELGLSGVICLGYPFRHPALADEPDRYRHLAGLRTPCLIVQGEADEYGGIEVPGTYALSPSIRLEFFPTDHDMRLPDPAMQRMLDLVVGFAERL
jgi:hypothetical protein